MFIIRNKATHTALRRVVTFSQHKNEKGELLLSFTTKTKAKHFMRNKGIDKSKNEVLFMTAKEMERLA